ncbi:unnamed protein product [Closterium sp. NIES-65]|nr:unnamed protein product [Closterium sp. NIES-65]CAI5978126.1 unnamed protein product [Closterium sp. NIES-65]
MAGGVGPMMTAPVSPEEVLQKMMHDGVFDSLKNRILLDLKHNPRNVSPSFGVLTRLKTTSPPSPPLPFPTQQPPHPSPFPPPNPPPPVSLSPPTPLPACTIPIQQEELRQYTAKLEELRQYTAKLVQGSETLSAHGALPTFTPFTQPSSPVSFIVPHLHSGGAAAVHS